MSGPRRLLGSLVAGLLIAGCSASGQAGDELQVADELVAALPAVSPASATAPAGTVLPVSAPVTAVVADAASRTLALAVSGPDRVLLTDLDAPAAPPRAVPLPGPAAELVLAKPGGPLLVPVTAAGQLLQIRLPGGESRAVPVPEGPLSAAVVGDRTVVALRSGGLAVLHGGAVVEMTGGVTGDVTLVASAGRVGVLDRLRTAVHLLNPSTGELGPGLRAGDGATHAVTDRFGRILVTDTRGGELLVFAGDPPILRQRYPVPGSPYGLAYDPVRDLAWVALTARNEVVGYDVAGGEPVLRHRFPTVRQPDAVAVDPETGMVVVGSASGEGVQVIRP